MLQEATIRLRRARDAYEHALIQVDRLAELAVANDPAQLEEAEQLQRGYRFEFTPADLRARLAPVDAPVVDVPALPETPADPPPAE